jgi:hypothetical protein
MKQPEEFLSTMPPWMLNDVHRLAARRVIAARWGLS